jgi:uncharacterized membrane protein
MSKKGRKKNKEKIAAKKAAVLKTEKKGRLPLFMTIAGVILIAGATALFIYKGDNKKTAVASAPLASGSTEVKFPVVLFQDGKARHFKHVDGDFVIRYFILKSSDGIIRAAFDACDVCWPAGKGYYQEGDHMVCRNCGRKFASVLVNEVKGGCNPAPLNRIMEDGQVIIRIKDILEGKQYFNFSGKA